MSGWKDELRDNQNHLKILAESDLPCSWIAKQLLEEIEA